jgi:hypothetical protein
MDNLSLQEAWQQHKGKHPKPSKAKTITDKMLKLAIADKENKTPKMSEN